MTRDEALNILNLTGRPTDAEIKAAFRAACRVSHPDKGGTQHAFERVQEANAVLTGKQSASPSSHAAPKAKPARPVQSFKTREEWLNAAARAIRAEMALAGLIVPSVKLSTGYGTAGKRREWAVIDAAQTADMMPQGFVTPAHELPAEAFGDLSEILCHVSTEKGSDKAELFRAILGFAGTEILASLGHYPHAAVSEKIKAKDGIRQLKIVCPSCGYTARTSQKWLNVGLPTCCCGEAMEVA